MPGLDKCGENDDFLLTLNYKKSDPSKGIIVNAAQMFLTIPLATNSKDVFDQNT